MNDPAKMDLSGIPTPKRPLSEEEIGRQYIESAILLPVMLKEAIKELRGIADSLSIISLYFEKKGLDEKLFTEEELTADGDDGQ